MRRALGLLPALAVVVASAPGPASAHLVGVAFGDVYAGVFHVLGGIDFMLPLFGVALLIAIRPKSAGRWALVAVPAAAAAGAFVTIVAGTGDWSWAPVAALAGLGICIALDVPFTAGAMVPIALATGFVIGHSNGRAAIDTSIDPWLYAAGTGTVAGCVVVLIAGLAEALSSRLGVATIGFRILGSWIAAIGLAMLGLALA